MKTKISILLAISCLTSIFAQVKENEILLRDKKDQPRIIKFDKTKISDESQAINIFLKSQFKADNETEFKPKRESRIDKLGFKSEKLQQYYKGIKVEFAIFNVVSKNGNLKSTNGKYVEIKNLNTKPKLNEQEALQYALRKINAETYLWDNAKMEQMLKNDKKDHNATYYPKGELVIVEKNIYTENPIPTLAYKFNIYATKPSSNKNYYVDATTGDIILEYSLIVHVEGTATTRYSGNRTIETEITGNQFRLRDNTRGDGVQTFNMQGGSSYANATDLLDNDNNWTSAEYNNANKDNALLDAHWGAMMTYDYFFQVHDGRNSIDNNGFLLKNYVNADLPGISSQFSISDNAFWDPTLLIMTYGKGTYSDPFVALDIIAHEIGHGFQTFTSNLTPGDERGSINEGLSDIWAAMVENFAAPEKDIYLLATDLGFTARSMSNPKSIASRDFMGFPDTYQGIYWDFGANPLHQNSTIISHMFYLLAEGSSTTDGINDNGDSYTIDGIGRDKAEKIMFRGQTVYFTSNTDFPTARNLTIMAAEDLYGVNSIEAITVNNAWYAVGIGNLINLDFQLDGDACACYNINTTFTLINNIDNLPVIWQVSSNLQILQSSNSAITVKATSSSIRASGFVTANVDGEPITKDIWVGQTNSASKILGPTTVQYGALVNYTSTAIQGATSYQWYLPYPYNPNATVTVDPPQWGIISGGDSRYLSTIVGPNNGLVQVMGVNKCGTGSSKNISVTVNTSGEGTDPGGGNMPFSTFGNTNTTDDNIFIYPNPSNDKFSVILGSNSKSEINLYDINGKQIYSKSTSQSIEIINTSGYTNGIYFLQIKGEINAIKKIIIQH